MSQDNSSVSSEKIPASAEDCINSKDPSQTDSSSDVTSVNREDSSLPVNSAANEQAPTVGEACEANENAEPEVVAAQVSEMKETVTQVSETGEAVTQVSEMKEAVTQVSETEGATAQVSATEEAVTQVSESQESSRVVESPIEAQPTEEAVTGTAPSEKSDTEVETTAAEPKNNPYKTEKAKAYKRIIADWGKTPIGKIYKFFDFLYIGKTSFISLLLSPIYVAACIVCALSFFELPYDLTLVSLIAFPFAFLLYMICELAALIWRMLLRRSLKKFIDKQGISLFDVSQGAFEVELGRLRGGKRKRHIRYVKLLFALARGADSAFYRIKTFIFELLTLVAKAVTGLALIALMIVDYSVPIYRTVEAFVLKATSDLSQLIDEIVVGYLVPLIVSSFGLSASLGYLISALILLAAIVLVLLAAFIALLAVFVVFKIIGRIMRNRLERWADDKLGERSPKYNKIFHFKGR